MRYVVGIAAVALLTLAHPQIASADGLKDKIVGAWTLAEGSEIMADGKKVVPWEKGSLIVDRSGQVSFFVLAKDRPKTDSPRKPSAPMVAWYGTYSVDDKANMVTVKVTGASSPGFEGGTREQTVSFKDDTMTFTGSKVQTPEGPITPVNVWKKIK